jgi:arylformamidase
LEISFPELKKWRIGRFRTDAATKGGERCLMFKEFIDISMLLQHGMPAYPGDVPYRMENSLKIPNGDFCNLGSFEMSMHSGTHIDAPLHFIAAGNSVTEMALDSFCGDVKVVELDIHSQVGVADLSQNPVVKGDRILLKILANQALMDSAVFSPDFIGITSAAAEWLVEKGVMLVGINCSSVDNPRNGDYEAHRILLSAGVVILENIDLSAVEAGEYHLACFPLRLRGANGSPVRAVLMR